MPTPQSGPESLSLWSRGVRAPDGSPLPVPGVQFVQEIIEGEYTYTAQGMPSKDNFLDRYSLPIVAAGFGGMALAAGTAGATGAGALTSEEAFLSGSADVAAQTSFASTPLMPAATPMTADALSAGGLVETSPGVFEALNAPTPLTNWYDPLVTPVSKIAPALANYLVRTNGAKNAAQQRGQSTEIAPYLAFSNSPGSTMPRATPAAQNPVLTYGAILAVVVILLKLFVLKR